jgi:hypothetical protein
MNALESRVHRDIMKTGWSLISVGREAADPAFTHTLGLFQKFSHAELIVVGAPSDTGGWLLNTLASRVSQGTRLRPSNQLKGILKPPFELAFQAVTSENRRRYLGATIRYYLSTEFPVLQVFLPDEQNRFPWHPGFQAKVPEDVRCLYSDSNSSEDVIADRSRN